MHSGRGGDHGLCSLEKRDGHRVMRGRGSGGFSVGGREEKGNIIRVRVKWGVGWV